MLHLLQTLQGEAPSSNKPPSKNLSPLEAFPQQVAELGLYSKAELFSFFFQDGASVDEQISREPVSPLSALLGVVRNMFPENVAVAAVNMNILGIITFSLMFGLALASIGEAGDAMVHAVDVSLLSTSRLGLRNPSP